MGELVKAAESIGVKSDKLEDFAADVVACAKREPTASFGEGCWIDHWHYNLDLIDAYLYFYPEKITDLFGAQEYLFWDDEHRVKPRVLRYSLRDGVVYQYNSVEFAKEKRDSMHARKGWHNFLHTKRVSCIRQILLRRC